MSSHNQLLQLVLNIQKKHLHQNVKPRQFTFFPCIPFGSDWDEQNHHFLKNQYFQLLPHFHGALHFGMLPRMEHVLDTRWFGNLASVLFFWNSPSCFHKLLRKHKISLHGLLLSSSDQDKGSASSLCVSLSATHSQKMNRSVQNRTSTQTPLIHRTRPSLPYNPSRVHLFRTLSKVRLG
jgi:hypothetical protein